MVSIIPAAALSHPYLFAVFTVAIGYAISCVVGLVHNIILARATGLPYLIYPMHERNMLYGIITAIPQVQKWVDTWESEEWRDWWNAGAYATKWKARKAYKRWGMVYLRVAPGGIVLECGDAKAIDEIMSHRERFPKPWWTYTMLMMYGPNIVVTEGQEWLRHRRVANPVFNERSNKMVWEVSIEQALDLLSHWKLNSQSPETTAVNTLGHDFMSIALHVISAIGFGIPMFFSEEKTATLPRPPFTNRNPDPGYDFTFAKALHFISFNITIHAAMMGGMLPRWFPKTLLGVYQKHKAAHRDFSRYLEKMISDAQENLKNTSSSLSPSPSPSPASSSSLLSPSPSPSSSLSSSSSPSPSPSPSSSPPPPSSSSSSSSVAPVAGRHDYMTHNLLSVMVAHSANQSSGANGNAKYKPLSPEELKGDVFVFMLAGHETTAQALNYAFLAMALEQEMQDWIAGLMREETKNLPADPREWVYEDAYENLNAAKYLMNETLRYFCIVEVVPKHTSASGCTFTPSPSVSRTPLRIATPMNINLVASGAHFDPQIWGPESHRFNPKRWDNGFQPVKGSFIPFSGGVRACLGKKFSTVEFTAIATIVLKDWRIRVKQRGGESREEARRRVWKTLEASHAEITNNVGEEVEVVFERRP